MNRITLVQQFIQHAHARVYIEIGVKKGLTFLRIDAPVKLGVDPVWPCPALLLHLLKNRRARYFKMTSDRFFRKKSSLFAQVPIDIALVDGLQEYRQSLSDVLNCLKYLSPTGLIILHDCNPPTESAAVPIRMSPSGKPLYTSGPWNGDVWKTVVHLRSLHHDLDVCVIDCDQGLGLITRSAPESTLSFDEKTIADMSYSALEKDRANLLNLKSPDYLDTFLKTLPRP